MVPGLTAPPPVAAGSWGAPGSHCWLGGAARRPQRGRVGCTGAAHRRAHAHSGGRTARGPGSAVGRGEGTYIQWDPTQNAWMQWNDGLKTWSRIPGQ